MYVEELILPIKKPQVVILQNQNPRGSVCNWAKPEEVIMHFNLFFFLNKDTYFFNLYFYDQSLDFESYQEYLFHFRGDAFIILLCFK